MSESILIKRLIVMFGEPDSADPPKFIDEYAKLTSRFDPPVLHKAADRLIAAGGRRWPTPKACVEACTDAQEELFGRPKESNHDMPWEVARRAAYKWANDYCDVTALGKQATAEGWRADLFYYAVSYVRNCPPGIVPMPMSEWRPPQEIIDNYRIGLARSAA